MKPPYESYYTRLKQELTGWKRALIVEETPLGYLKVNDAVVKLTIPKRTRAVLSQYKCRAKSAKVEGIYPIVPYGEPDKQLDLDLAYSWFTYPCLFEYRVGEVAFSNYFDPDPYTCCSYGIHFFKTYREAANYDFS